MLAIPLFLAGCVAPVDEVAPIVEKSYDEATLTAFKAALPSSSRLTARTPQDAANAAGDAVLPNYAIGPASAINAMSVMMIDIIERVVQQPPSAWDPDARKFLWGPGPNEDGAGLIALYIQENEAGADFQFTYAVLRLAEGAPIEQAVPVIWGGATPDPVNEDLGVGATLYDFDASHAFEAAADPAYDPAAPRTTGRFVAVYGSQIGAEGAFVFNLAILRNLMPAEGTDSGLPINLNYLFGEATGLDGNMLTFLDWEQLDEICDANRACFEQFDPQVGSAQPGLDGLEVLTIHMAFANRGIGRAEGVVALGDLGPLATGQVVGYAECWNETVEQTQFAIDLNLNDAEPPVFLVPDGTCSAPFTADLTELGIPSLEGVRSSDPGMIKGMECIALHGIPGCQTCLDQNAGDVEACL